ncbi:MAG: hypothetical protein PVI90_01570 [Desulfobacteraceae bacterium]|jgi:hypothetical protein
MGFLQGLTCKIGEIDDMNKIKRLIENVLEFCNIEQDMFETTRGLSDRIRAVNPDLSDFLATADHRIDELRRLHEIENEFDQDRDREVECWRYYEGEAEKDGVFNEEIWFAEISRLDHEDSFS